MSIRDRLNIEDILKRVKIVEDKVDMLLDAGPAEITEDTSLIERFTKNGKKKNRKAVRG